MKILDDKKILTLEWALAFYNQNDPEYELSAKDVLELFDTNYSDDIELEDQVEAERDLQKSNLYDDLIELQKLFGNEPPFTFDTDNKVISKFRYSNKILYQFCLFLAKKGAGQIIIDDQKFTSDKLGKIFEHIVLTALKKARPEYEIERFESIHTELEPICKKFNIVFHSGTFKDRCNKNAQDGGVDIIAYRPTHNHAKRGHIILIQCAAGKNYTKKDDDISLDDWKIYMGDYYTHTKILAIPYTYFTSDGHQLGGTKLGHAGEIIDRIFLWQYLEDNVFQNEYNDMYTEIKNIQWIS
jgi:hypothetical protein